MPRALIIGGGASGLGAALLCRRLGLEVLLLERAESLGPLLRGFQRQNLAFETGFHYAGGLAQGGVLHRYLDRLGLFRAGLKTRPLPDPGGETLRIGQGAEREDILLPRGLAAFKRLFPPSAALDAFFAEGADIVAGSPFLNFGRSWPGRLEAAFALDEGPTLDEKLAALELPDRLRTLLGFRCLLYGPAPAETWWSDFALDNTPFLEGAHTVEGGGAGLVRAFEAALAEAGVEARTGRQVTALEVDGQGRVLGLTARRADGAPEREAGDFCIYCGNPAALPGLLPDGALRPVLLRRLAALRPTGPPFLVFATAGVDFCQHRQLFLGPDDRLDHWLAPDSGFFYLSGGPGRGGRWPVTIISLLPEAATLAWRGSRPGARPAEYEAFKRRRAEAVVQSVLARCPELRGDLEIVASATDLTLIRYCFAQGGGIYGRRHGPGQPPIWPVTRVRGLALAGQDIVLPGLLGALASAALAVGSLAGYESLGEVLEP
jgi:all-trans-retinol 13,14-reductase